MTTDKKPGDWMENPQNLANIGHFLGGYVVLVTAVMFAHTKTPVFIVEALLFAYVLVKEYWYDLHYETGETLRSSTEDALGYIFGNLVAWGLLFLSHRVMLG